MKKGLRAITLSSCTLLSLAVFTAIYRNYISNYGLKTNAEMIFKMVSNTNNTPLGKHPETASNVITILNFSLSNKLDKDDAITCKLDSLFHDFSIEHSAYKGNYYFSTCNLKLAHTNILSLAQQTENKNTHTYKTKAIEHFKNILIKDKTSTKNNLVLSANANNILNTIYLHSSLINSRTTLDIYYS
ncbi:hypothetical protein [Formosa sp. L2A11]|uniref:hypothetical protein n=1 Tax=Formosa sp. L2A11 TaxID=2686363 RepID=UPI00131DA651|nr:hypothetical protein [Formosa sp. L2A11]